jgi:LETM1-like protein
MRHFPNATQLTQSILSQFPLPEGRHQERLAHLPPVIIQCMNRVVTGQAFPSLTAQLSPTFLQRGKLVAHLEKVSAADHFLRTNSLESIQSKRLLQEVCRDRLLETSQSVAELRHELQQWLETTSDSTVQNNKAALLGLLAYNGCYQIRKDQERKESLTRLLFTSPDAVANAALEVETSNKVKALSRRRKK